MLAKFGDLFLRWRPVRLASIAVEHHRAGFQRFLELFPAERDGLVMVVRTYNFKIHAVVHESPGALEFSDLSR